MWDDYGVIRPGRMPFDVYENGQIVFTQNPVAFDAPIGTVVGTISVINATPTYKLSVGQNPYFAISGNNLVSKAALVGGVDFVQIFAIKGFKRIAQVVRVVVSGGAAPPTPLPGTFSIVLNLSGAEDNSGFPGALEMGYWVVRGVPTFRIPLSWPALQSTTFGSLNAGYLASVSAVLAAAASVGAKLIVDFHNFGAGPGGQIGAGVVSIAAFVDLWRKFAAALRADPNYHVIEAYDPMNEWQSMDPANPSAPSTPAGQAIVLQANHDVMFALRGDGDNTPLYLEWDHFSGAWDAVANNISQLFDLILTDPARNSKGQIHCYPDRDSSGSHFVASVEQAAAGLAPPGLSTNINIIEQRMAAVVALAASKGVPLFLGETGISSDALQLGGNDDPFWISAGDAMFAYCQANNIQVGVWAGGPGFQTSYGYNPSPSNVANPALKDFTTAGLQAVQTALIEKYTGYSGAQPTAYRLDAPFGVTPYAPPGTPIPGFKARYGGKITSTKSFIPSATLLDGTDAGGTFLPNPITMGPGLNGLAPFSYTPASALAAIRIALQSTSGLVDPPSVGCSSATDFFSTLGIAPNIYATFRLVNTYVNPAFKLQNSNGDQLDFYFNARGDLPRQVIQDWANSRSITILTWYDQSGLGAHRNYAAGKATLILVDTDGYPSVKFVTSNTFANVPSPSIGNGKMSIFALINPADTSGFIASQDQGIDNFRLQGNFFGIAPNASSYSASVAFGTTTNTWNEICATYSNLYATNNLKGYLNGTLAQQVNCAQFVNAANSNQFTVDNFQFSPSLPYIGLQRILMTQYVEYQASDVTTLHGIITTYFGASLPDTLSAINPRITGAAPSKLFGLSGTSTPFAAISIADENSGSPTDTVTITLTGAAATLAGSGLSGSNPYTLSAAAAATITSRLKALVLSSSASIGSTININLQVTSSAGTSSSTSACVVTVSNYGIETAFTPPVGTFTPISYKGVNMVGAENHPATVYPIPFFQYKVDYYISKGFGLIRLQINSQNVYPTAFGALDTAALTSIKAMADYCFQHNIRLVIDLHDFGNVWNSQTNSSAPVLPGTTGQDLFNDFWSRMGSRFSLYANVIIGQMNEPVPAGGTVTQWQQSAAENVLAIRAAGANNLILLAGGVTFDNASSWVSSGNAAAWHGYNGDPANNFMFEMHQYLNANNDGQKATCTQNGSTVLAAATAWLVTEGFQCLLTEFGFPPATWQSFGDDLNWDAAASPFSTSGITDGGNQLAYMTAHAAQWPGWTFFTGGAILGGNPPFDNRPSGGQANAFDIDPTVNGSNNGFVIPVVDQPQMAVLVANL